jgi:hypothetical protein
MLAESRLSGPLGIPERQMGMVYSVVGFGGSLALSRAMLTSGRVSRPIAVATPVVAAGVIALVLGLSGGDSVVFVGGSLIGSMLGVIL